MPRESQPFDHRVKRSGRSKEGIPLLFALYHLWQIPFTWPLIGLVLAFGLLMWLRKDLLCSSRSTSYMWLSYGEYPLARFLHLTR